MTSFKATLAASLLALAIPLLAAPKTDVTGIKAANLKGANLELMHNHDPASERENFILLDGYEANLFASEPMIENPIHMQWDSRGRLWVACSWSYPQLKPGQKADDKIIILEDTDNDGKADKSTVFADGLYLPTGLELANGGCYIGQSPDVFFYQDTDGDDVADVKTLALTGFGIEDSHHSISAWRRGPGGWLYFQEGIFLHTQVETPHGLIRNFNGGIYQYNPRTGELRVFCSGTGGNPWGHVFDDWGQSFMVNNPKIMYISPATGNSGQNVKVETLISTTKQCGGDLARGSHIRDDLRNQLLTGRFKDRSVVRYEFIENESGFSANVLKPLIQSKHPNFRPVDIKMGPDGAIYVADWYNSIINHANHDFRDPRRDNGHGRIWRITKTGSPLVKKPQLVGQPLSELVTQLGSPEAWNRHQARKELSEHDPDDVLDIVESWAQSLDPSRPDHDHCLVEAMWACQNVERVSESILLKTMAAKSGHARSAAARTLRYWFPQLENPIPLLAELAADPFPRTRMEAVLSAGFIPDPAAFTAALNALDHPLDKSINLALAQTTLALEPYWRPALEAGTLTFNKPEHQDHVQKESGIGFEKTLKSFLAQPSATTEEIANIKSQLLTNAEDPEIFTVLKKLTTETNPNAATLTSNTTIALLEALLELPDTGKASKRTRKLTHGLRPFLNHPNPEIVLLTVKNLGAWKTASAANELFAILESSDLNPATRRAAAVSIAKLGRKGPSNKLKNLATSGDIATRYAATNGLIAANLNDGINATLALYTDSSAEGAANEDPVPLIQAILANSKGAQLLTKRLTGITLNPEVKARVAAFHHSSGQLPSDLAALFTAPSAAGTSLTASLQAEDRDALATDVLKHGDPYRGEDIFRRPALACVNCHAVGSAGAQIGPNLATIGSSAPADYMVQSILEPSAAIAEHYENTLLTLKDGSVRMGVISAKSNNEVILKDSAQAGKEIRLQADQIVKEEGMPSLMPAGLADLLENRQEFLDLSNFLSVLGHPGDFANDESPVIRKWLLTTDSTTPPSEITSWTPAYSKVDGTLPAKDFTTSDSLFAKGSLKVQVAGTAKLKLNATEGLQLWLDDQKVTDPTAPLELSPGRRTLTFRIDRKTRPNNLGIRVEVETPADSPLKFQPEGGS